MLNERESDHPVDLAIGADACYYHPHAAHVLWNEETQPFGYQAVCGLFQSMTQAVKARHREENAR